MFDHCRRNHDGRFVKYLTDHFAFAKMSFSIFFSLDQEFRFRLSIKTISFSLISIKIDDKILFNFSF